MKKITAMHCVNPQNTGKTPVKKNNTEDFLQCNFNLSLGIEPEWLKQINCLQIIRPWLQDDYGDLSLYKETPLKETKECRIPTCLS